MPTACVLLPTTNCEPPGARETGVPATVTAPPAVRVWLLMMYWPWELAWMDWAPIVMKGVGGVVGMMAGWMVEVLEPTTRTVLPPCWEVWRAMIVGEGPELRVKEDPGMSV